MALVNIEGVPLTQIGAPTRQGVYMPAAAGTAHTLDATNEAIIMVGYVWTTDGGSHTIDTSGSSSLGWRTNTSTFNNGSTSVKIGLASVESGAGPPARAVNSSGTITFNVSKTAAGGGGGITSAAWQESVPDTGTMTIANGDLVAFAVQMTARAGADAINVIAVAIAAANCGLPCVTTYVPSTFSNGGFLPNARITFSDGARGYFVGGALTQGALVTTTWNSGSATKEYGNYLKLPFPCKIYGIVAAMSVSANLDLVLYSDPFGTPVAEKTISVLATQVALNTTATYQLLFSTPFEAKTNQELVYSFKPGASNVTATARSVNAATDQDCDSGGGSCYAVSRATGVFAAQNSQKDRYIIGALVQALANPARASFALGV